MTQSVRTLLANLIDYAGLYPPAKLSMEKSVENYARDRAGPHEWMLGRFVCAASRLKELSQAAAPLMPGTYATSGYRERAEIGDPWHVSVVVDGPLPAAVDAILAFNERHEREENGLAVADAIELKVETASAVDEAIDAIPEDIFPYFEFPAGGDPRGLIASLAGTMCAAKIRTGGVTADAFPSVEQVAAFMVACSAADVPFKATAGLHHALRAEQPLTYEKGGPRGVMHGFLNVFVAACMVRMARAGERPAAEVLAARDAKDFHFTDDGIRWRDAVLEVGQVAKAREVFALSYGSCSFDEPVEELKGLGLI